MVKSFNKPVARWRTLAFTAVVVGLVVATLPLTAFARVVAELDRERAVAGETVTLTFRTDNPQQKLTPDLSVLEQNFVVLDQRSETNLSIVNGRQTALVRLLVTLEPRQAGQIAIPAFEIGQDRTQPLRLTVDPAPELAPGELPPVFLEVEVVPGEGPHYVHAQLGLQVRIFYHPDTIDATIGQPSPSPAAVRLLQETPYQAERNGQRYRVLERHYAIFPERSGELVIPAMRLSGRLVDRNRPAIWQPGGRGRRVNAESEEIRLEIEPRKDAFEGDTWIPARELRISQQVSEVERLKVGEPVTRTVIVEAAGLEENMLVEPAWPEIEGARVYPDQPQGITRDDGQWVLGHKEFRYAVVPEQEGELVLPELKLYWWDTVNDQQSIAVLPEQRIVVEPSDLVPSSASMPTATAVPMESAQLSSTGGMASEPAYWRWLALLFAALWLATLVLAIRWRKTPAPESANGQPSWPEDQRALLVELKKAVRARNPQRARNVIQRWLEAAGTGHRSLLEFAAECGDPELRDALYVLDSVGYQSGEASTWDDKDLCQRLEAWSREKLKQADDESAALTDLYAR